MQHLPIPTPAEKELDKELNDIPEEPKSINDNQEEKEEEAVGNEVEPTDPAYDYLWKNQEAFVEANFAQNFGSKRKWNNVFWTVLFWINLIISAVLFFMGKPWASESYTKDDLSRNDMLIIGAVSIGVTVVIGFLTYIYVLFCPRVYIKSSMIVMLILLLGCMIPLAILTTPLILILTGVIFIAVFIYQCRVCSKLNFSADVLQSSAMIMKKYPAVFFFSIGQLIFQSALSYLFSCGAVLVYCRNISYWLYVYIILSYFWITQTTTYVTYTTIAGLTSAWYFLNGTDYMPQSIIGRAFLNSIGPSFGACALAGFLEGISNGFRWISKKGETLSCCSGGCLFSCCKCCFNCFKSIVKFFVGVIDRYALIYCAMFGVPAKEGVKRWANLKTKKIIKQLLNTSIISLTFGFYSYASMAVGACVGGLIGMKFFGKDTPQFTFMFVTSMTCALNGLLLISKPMEVMSDTLFLGFAEAPLRLEVGAKEVYDLFGDDTKRILDHDIKEAKGEKEEGCCDGCCGSGDDGCCCNIC